MKKTIMRAAAALLALAMCAMLAACSGKKLGMKQVVGQPLATAVTQLSTITGKSLTYYSQGELSENGKTYSPSDGSLIEFLSGEFTAVDIVETNGAVESVTFYSVYNSPLEYAGVLSTLKEYYGDDFDKSDNFGMYDEWSWSGTPDGRVQFFKYDSMFEVKYTA